METGFVPQPEKEKIPVMTRIMGGAKEKAEKRLGLRDIPAIAGNFLRESRKVLPTLNPIEYVSRLNPFKRIFGQNIILDGIKDVAKFPGDFLRGGPLNVVKERISRRAGNFKESIMPERLKVKKLNPVKRLLTSMNPLKKKFGIAGMKI